MKTLNCCDWFTKRRTLFGSENVKEPLLFPEYVICFGAWEMPPTTSDYKNNNNNINISVTFFFYDSKPRSKVKETKDLIQNSSHQVNPIRVEYNSPPLDS